MYNNDLISVIIPVYNTEQYVRQTLESVVNQTYKNLEILVIDDGSTDGSPSICDEFLIDNRVQVFHRPNIGMALSRQYGIDICRGTYFVTLDSDDYVSEDYIEKLYATIQKHNADISVCGVFYFNDGSDDFQIVYMPNKECEKLTVTNELLVSSFHKITNDYLLTDSWNKMYRTQFVQDTNVKFQLKSKYNGSDLQFNHRLAVHCPTYTSCYEALLYHRGRKGSRVRRKDKRLQEGFEIIMNSLIKECELEAVSAREQLSSIYYGLIGLAVVDVFLYGGNIVEKHSKFCSLISSNKKYLEQNKKHLDKLKGNVKFRLTSFSLPAFVLSNALWLDAVSLLYRLLQKIKIRLRKIRKK